MSPKHEGDSSFADRKVNLNWKPKFIFVVKWLRWFDFDLITEEKR